MRRHEPITGNTVCCACAISGQAAAEPEIESFTIASKDDVNVGPVAASGISQTFPDQQEIERRRVLVRVLFNDFWNRAHNKPAAFAERLDQAEDYLNARLAAHGELWRLDANTRPILGLPPRSSSAN
jgi:hypothetical protein